jgi:hypothetical protein
VLAQGWAFSIALLRCCVFSFFIAFLLHIVPVHRQHTNPHADKALQKRKLPTRQPQHVFIFTP